MSTHARYLCATLLRRQGIFNIVKIDWNKETIGIRQNHKFAINPEYISQLYGELLTFLKFVMPALPINRH